MWCGKCLNLIWSLYIKKLGIFYWSVSNLSNLRIFYLLKILANGIGHKLLQQLFKSVSYNLQHIIYITATIRWNVSIYIKMYEQTTKKEKESNKETWYLLVKGRNVGKQINKGKTKFRSACLSKYIAIF